jgi:hypothetical protein
VYPSYRAAHANRGRETGSNDEHLRVIRVRSRVRSTRRKRVRTEREATRSGYRAAGRPAATGTGLPGRGRRSTPTAPDVEVRRRQSSDGTGNRVSVNGVERRRSRLAGRPGLDSGNGVRFAGQRRRGGTAAGKPGATPERNGVGQPTDRALSCETKVGSPTRGPQWPRTSGDRWTVSNGSGSGQPGRRPKTGIARRTSGSDGRCDDRAKG